VTSVHHDWFSCMRRGDFASAWAISDSILAQHAGMPSWHLPRHEQWIWDGTPLDGRRVLIRCYHGLGDTIQFARFIPLVERIAREVTVWVQPSLIPLLRTMHTRATFLPLHDGTPEVEYDVDVEIMELAHVFRITPETIPRPPYLFVEPSAVERGIGVVWQTGDWDSARAIDPEVMRPLLATPGVRFYPLHRDSPGAQTPFETARLMRALDLVISVDTMTAHLAGALGVPVFTLLPFHCDWRWMADRDDSPWYPAMRLFRQPRPGDWSAAIDGVRYAVNMTEEKKTSLNDWGIDLDKFKERAKESLSTAKGDLTEITGTLRQTLVQAKDVVMGLQTGGAPAAAELKAGFERAWHEIENAFKSAREKAKAPETAAEPETASAEAPVADAPAGEPPADTP
jgi:hypothetical protein